MMVYSIFGVYGPKEERKTDGCDRVGVCSASTESSSFSVDVDL